LDFPLILRTIKDTLKARGVTYRDLAGRMGIPESTLKKMLSAKDLSFKRLAAICEAVELDLADVLASVAGRPVQTVSFTPSQEASFKENPSAFGFYWKLVFERESPATIAAANGLSGRATFRYLRQLDSMGLIELHPGNVVRLPYIRPVRWDMTSPFVQSLVRRWAGRTVADLAATDPPDGALIVQYFQLHRSSYEELLVALRSLETEFAKRTARDLSLRQGDLVRVRTVFAVAEGSYLRSIDDALTDFR